MAKRDGAQPRARIEVPAWIRQWVRAGVFPGRLKLENWSPGTKHWLLDVVAPGSRNTLALFTRIRHVVNHRKTVGAARMIVLGLSLAGFGLPSATSRAEEAPKPIPFGRYELVKGQDNPVCIAFGDQIRAYPKIPPKPRPNQSGTWLNRSIAKLDFRCDFPLESKGGISVPTWKSFDPTSAPHLNWIRAAQVFNGYFKIFKPWGRNPLSYQGVDLDKRELFIRSARDALLYQLIGWGVIRFQTATLAMQDLGSLSIYRFSDPPNTLQNCWTIGFDSDSPLYKLRFISFRIAQVFQFGKDTYYVTGLTSLGAFIADEVDIRVASLDKLAVIDFTADSPLFVTDQAPVLPEFPDKNNPANTCEFNLRSRDERNSFY